MDTREQIMDIGRAMVQARGYNALSFREIAKLIGVKNASIHYHFPTKGDLGAALASRYADTAAELLAALSLEPQDKEATLAAYIAAFRSALANDNRMCLCGILMAERDDLPDAVKQQVDRFTDVNIRWLKTWLTHLYPDMADVEVADHALAIFSAIEGAQLIARGRADIAVFDHTMTAYRRAGLLP